MSIISDVDTMFELSKNCTDFTVDNECSNCGNCCSNFLPLSEGEVDRIKRYIKKHGIKPRKFNAPVANPVVDMVCPFRSEFEKKCVIYSIRPLICRDFRCDKPAKEIQASKRLYHRKNRVVNMRLEFFGENPLEGL